MEEALEADMQKFAFDLDKNQILRVMAVRGEVEITTVSAPVTWLVQTEDERWFLVGVHKASGQTGILHLGDGDILFAKQGLLPEDDPNPQVGSGEIAKNTQDFVKWKWNENNNPGTRIQVVRRFTPPRSSP